MHLLVSFCTVKAPGGPALGVLDADSGDFHALEIPDAPEAGAGITGLAADSQFIYAAVRQPAGLLVFERSSLRLLNLHSFTLASDIHSIWITDETLYVVSTGTDEIIAARMMGPEVLREEVFWRPARAADRADLHHLNAIYGWSGDLFVSGFGPKAGRQWTSAGDGFIVDITRGYTLAVNVRHPHSVMVVGESLAYCESTRGEVSIVGQARVAGLPGYTRGLCQVSKTIFAGTSVRRLISRTTGEPNEVSAGEPNPGKCAVSRIAIGSFAIERTYDLTAYGEGIYDLLPIEDISGWPIN